MVSVNRQRKREVGVLRGECSSIAGQAASFNSCSTVEGSSHL